MLRRSASFSAVIAAIATVQTGCASLALQSRAHGALYTGATMSQLTTQNALGGREGRACAHSVLGLVTWGDGGVGAAARAGSIDLVAAADEESFGVLGIYARVCSVVSGTALVDAPSPEAPPSHEPEGAGRGHAHPRAR